MALLARFGRWKVLAAVGAVLAIAVAIGAMSIKTIDVPKPPAPRPYIAPAPSAAADPKTLLADLSDGGSTGGLAPGSAHALIKAAIDDGQPTRRTVVIDNSEDDGRAEADERSPANPRRPAPAAILAYEQELATLREMPTDLESLQVAAAGLTRLYTQLQLLSSNASGEWKLAALVLMGECATALAERGEAATPTLCNDQDLTREECVALLEKLEEQSARERATDIYRSAVTFAEQQHLDTAYSRLAKSRLAGNK